jgi:hypothetical protein
MHQLSRRFSFSRVRKLMGMQYIRLPPAYVPYVLRVSIDAGTPVSKNSIFKTNFPLDGGKFGRDRFAERKCVLFKPQTYTIYPLSSIGYPQTFRNQSKLTFQSIMPEPLYFGLNMTAIPQANASKGARATSTLTPFFASKPAPQFFQQSCNLFAQPQAAVPFNLTLSIFLSMVLPS